MEVRKYNELKYNENIFDMTYQKYWDSPKAMIKVELSALLEKEISLKSKNQVLPEEMQNNPK